MMRIIAATLVGIFLFGEAHAAGSIAYGSRVGMEVTVVGVSGIGTSHAVIRVKHTRENAKTFCTEYEQRIYLILQHSEALTRRQRQHPPDQRQIHPIVTVLRRH